MVYDNLRLEGIWYQHKVVSEQDLRKPVLLSIVVFVYTISHYWQPCIFEFKVHTYQVIQSIKQLIFGKYSTMSGRGHRGRPRRVIPEVSERPAVPERDEHVVCSTTASMNQSLAAGQAGPSGPPKGAQVPGLFTAEQVAQIAQIVAIATRQ